MTYDLKNRSLVWTRKKTLLSLATLNLKNLMHSVHDAGADPLQ